MTPPSPFVGLLIEPAFWWGLLKWAYLFVFLLYLAFSVVVLVQIKQMVRSVKSEFSPTIILMGWVHVGIALAALVLAFVVL